MAPKTVHEMWMGYAVAVGVPLNGSTQHRETCLAFHAGVYALLCELRSDEMPDEEAEGVSVLASYYQEAKETLQIMAHVTGKEVPHGSEN